MVDHDLLHRELSALASALRGDFDLSEGLHQLGVTAADALAVAGAGVTVRMPSGDTEYLSGTDPATLHVERRQDELQEGACVDAIRTSEIVAVGDLTVGAPWPAFTPVLLDAGFRAVAGVPIPFEGRPMGAINLYAATERTWTTEELAATRLIADLAAGLLINRHLLRTTQTLAGQLQHALNSRVIIEQAKGIIAGRHESTPEAAFEVIRSFARSRGRKIHDVAREVIVGDLRLSEAAPQARVRGQDAATG